MAAAEIQVVNPSNLAKIESFLNDPSYKEIIENSSTFNSRLCAERRMRMPFIDTQTGVAQSHCNLFMTRKQRMPGAREGQVYTYPSQRWRKARRQYLTMSSTRWGWSALDAAENAGDGENSSGIPGDALAGDDSRDGSQTATKDDPKEWFYDDLAIEEMETGEEPDPESDEDYYDDTYANRRKRRGVAPTGPGSRGGRRGNKQPDDTPSKRGRAYSDKSNRSSTGSALSGTLESECKRVLSDSPSRGPLSGALEPSHSMERPPKRSKSSAASQSGNNNKGRGRKRAGQGTLPYEVPGDAEKPYGCELCGAKYKTRPGLTYHFTHTHKDPGTSSGAAPCSDGDSRDSRPGAHTPPAPAQPATEYQDSYVTFLNNPAGTSSGTATPPLRKPSPPPRPMSADTSSSDSAHAPLVAPGSASSSSTPASVPAPAPSPSPGSSTAAPAPATPAAPPIALPLLKEPETKASPSPYCDFCLGDDRENKKTGTPEKLVSCSDCGRSGHPTCLQFTVNMIVSVRKYRWQCIECKCCSVCGTSDNDDQLLFCDDCDRGYHMYCLAPPLDTPPEGSWSCALCISEFHTKR